MCIEHCTNILPTQVHIITANFEKIIFQWIVYTSHLSSSLGTYFLIDIFNLSRKVLYIYVKPHQVLDSNLKIPQGLYVIAFLYNYTQPQAVSILPLDLKNSVIIISTILNLLTTSLQQGRITDVKDTVVMSFSNVYCLKILIFLHAWIRLSSMWLTIFWTRLTSWDGRYCRL